MRRLFSMFARGTPGAALLLMRIIAGGALITQAYAGLAGSPEPPAAAVHVLLSVLALLLIVGLWTPYVAALGVVAAVWNALFGADNLGYQILFATLSGALALLGPGAWSIDARLFGMKRVEIVSERNTGGNSPPI